jgi:hypothetical protein
MRVRLLLSVAAMVGGLVAAEASAVPAITFTGGETTDFFSDRTFGYEFSTNSAIRITALGYWDDGSDGLTDSHEVGIWNSDGSILLASAVVPSGTGGTLDSGFRFVAITPVVLSAGQSFLAGGFNSSNDAIIRYTTATTIPGITLGSTRFDPEPYGSFQAPTEQQGPDFDFGYFGPNFQVAAVPEPATWALTIAGFGLVGAMSRRRRAVTA